MDCKNKFQTFPCTIEPNCKSCPKHWTGQTIWNLWKIILKVTMQSEFYFFYFDNLYFSWNVSVLNDLAMHYPCIFLSLEKLFRSNIHHNREKKDHNFCAMSGLRKQIHYRMKASKDGDHRMAENWQKVLDV